MKPLKIWVEIIGCPFFGDLKKYLKYKKGTC